MLVVYASFDVLEAMTIPVFTIGIAYGQQLSLRVVVYLNISVADII